MSLAACGFPLTAQRSFSRSNALALKPVSSVHKCGSVRGLDRRRRRVAAPVVRRVVATSEHWYEEEEEFDSLTDAMTPKLVILVAAPAAAAAAAGTGDGAAMVEALRAYLQPQKFAQAFSSQEALPFAQKVWAGRDKAPYFLRVRQRGQLDVAAAAAGAGEGNGGSQEQRDAAAAEFWSELLQQNWRVELDAGLGSAAPESEALLVVASGEAVGQLMAAAALGHDSLAAVPAAGTVSVMWVDGTQAGDPLDWRLLRKRLLLAAAQPGSSEAGDTLLTMLEKGEGAAAAAAAQ